MITNLLFFLIILILAFIIFLGLKAAVMGIKEKKAKYSRQINRNKSNKK